jgi:TctA family transporter
LTGALNTVNFVISLITFYTLDKARNGSIVAINTLVKSITFFDLVYFFIVSVIVGAMCVFVTLFIARRANSPRIL